MDLNDTTSKVNGPLVHFTPYSLSHTFQIIHILAFFRNVAFTMHLDIYTMSRYTVHAMHVEKPKEWREYILIITFAIPNVHFSLRYQDMFYGGFTKISLIFVGAGLIFLINSVKIGKSSMQYKAKVRYNLKMRE
jgi:hypothetical protein